MHKFCLLSLLKLDWEAFKKRVKEMKVAAENYDSVRNLTTETDWKSKTALNQKMVMKKTKSLNFPDLIQTNKPNICRTFISKWKFGGGLKGAVPHFSCQWKLPSYRKGKYIN